MVEAKDDEVNDDGCKGERGESKLDLDMILREEIGQFGSYQRRTLGLCLVVALLSGYSTNEYVFSAARIPTRCEIPECPSSEFAPPWLELALPSVGGSFDNCARFNGSGAPPAGNGSCPADLFDWQTVVPCEEYVYENTDTVVYEFNLACKVWWQSLIGSAYMSGWLLSLPMSGYLADARGRRLVLALNAFNRAWLGLARSFTTSYTAFIILEFLEALFGAAGFSCAYTMAIELVGPKYRVQAGAMTSSCFSIGTFIQAAVAWALPYWRHFYYALYIPQLFTIFYFWIMPESVRWYMSKGRYTESEAVLKQAAKVNGRVLSEMSLQGLKQNLEEERKRNEIEKEQKVKEPWLVTLVFQHKPVLLRCMVTPVWWITTLFVYYGLSLNAVNLLGNKYLNYMVVTLVDIPGFWTSGILLNKIGRKPLVFAGFWICAVCQFSFIFIPEGHFGLSLAIYLLGKLCISMVATAIYVYTNELYPTRYRTTLFAFSSMIGRIGSIAAPLTLALGSLIWEPLPYVIFGSLATLAGLLVLPAPETRGTTLPDSMQQAADLGRPDHQT